MKYNGWNYSHLKMIDFSLPFPHKPEAELLPRSILNFVTLSERCTEKNKNTIRKIKFINWARLEHRHNVPG